MFFEGAEHDNIGSTCDSLSKIIFFDFHAGLMMSGPRATPVQDAFPLFHGRYTTLDGHALETHDCVFTQTEDSSNMCGVTNQQGFMDLIAVLAQPAQ